MCKYFEEQTFNLFNLFNLFENLFKTDLKSTIDALKALEYEAVDIGKAMIETGNKDFDSIHKWLIENRENLKETRTVMVKSQSIDEKHAKRSNYIRWIEEISRRDSEGDSYDSNSLAEDLNYEYNDAQISDETVTSMMKAFADPLI